MTYVYIAIGIVVFIILLVVWSALKANAYRAKMEREAFNKKNIYQGLVTKTEFKVQGDDEWYLLPQRKSIHQIQSEQHGEKP
jgi:hypothetical protein